MKISALLTALLLSLSLCAQENYNYFLYKVDGAPYKYEIKSNDDYILSAKTGAPEAWAVTSPDKLFDLKNGVCIMYNDKAGMKWYHVEMLDSMYSSSQKLEDKHEEKVINGHKCRKYFAVSGLDVPGGLYGLKNIDYTYEYTIWIATDMKMQGKTSRYLLSQITGAIANADLPGVPIRIECKMYKKGKVKYEANIEMEKASNTMLKASEIKQPWTMDDIRATYPDPGVSIKWRAHDSVWTDETFKDYMVRIKALYAKITGSEPKKLYPFRINPFM